MASALHGNSPDVIIGLRRDRYGVFTGTVQRVKLISTAGAESINPAWLADYPRPWRIPFREATSTIANSQCIITFSYEGADPDAADDGGNDENLVVEFSGTMSEEPIQTHPGYEKMKSTYGWNDDRDGFSEFISGTGGRPLSTNKATTPKKSPLFGVESYLAPGGTLTVSYAVRSIPSSVYNNVGEIVTNPKGLSKIGFPSLNDRNWLKMMPDVQHRGNISQVTETHYLSGKGKWRPEVYGASQFK